jgi:hypothetical protein
MRALLSAGLALLLVAGASPSASGAAPPRRDVRIAAGVLTLDAAGRVGVPLRCAARAATARCRGRITLNGATGPQGPAGPPAAPQRVAGSTTTVNSLAAGGRLTFSVDCPAGRLAMGGGGRIVPAASNTAEGHRLQLQASFPLDTDTWQIGVVAIAGIDNASRAFQVTPYVICT